MICVLRILIIGIAGGAPHVVVATVTNADQFYAPMIRHRSFGWHQNSLRRMTQVLPCLVNLWRALERDAIIFTCHMSYVCVGTVQGTLLVCIRGDSYRVYRSSTSTIIRIPMWSRTSKVLLVVTTASNSYQELIAQESETQFFCMHTLFSVI